MWIVFRFTTLPVMTQTHNQDGRLTEALRLYESAHERLTESVRLRRAVGHQPGVAAGLLALAELAVRSGRPDEAADLLAEAAATAEAAGAAGTLRWVDEARAELAGQSGA